jgi:hypothetical protein
VVGTTAAAFVLFLASQEVRAQSPADGTRPGPAAAVPPIADIQSAAWLAGCWEAASPGGESSVEEQWMAPRAGLMVGMGRTVRDGEARGFEHLTLRVRDGRLVYHAAPSDQAPNDFPARAVEGGRLEFANPAHDFPRKIVYARFDDDFFQAAVFAEVEGAEPAFLVPYRRVRCAR